ncbi:hypothetical protein MHYP_G00007670 [Metynnis hypsauchen]
MSPLFGENSEIMGTQCQIKLLSKKKQKTRRPNREVKANEDALVRDFTQTVSARCARHLPHREDRDTRVRVVLKHSGGAQSASSSRRVEAPG